MDCRRARKSLLEYAEGGLSPSRREQVGKHLESCGDCLALADKLAVSAAALEQLTPVEMPDEASHRVLSSMKSRGASAPAPGFFHSTRAIATAGIVTAVLVALAIVVGVVTGGKPSHNTQVLQKGQSKTPVSDSGAAGTTAKQVTEPAAEAPPLGSLVLPLAKVTSTDYNDGTMRTMAENLEVKKQFARRYSLSDAINLRIVFIQKLADQFVAVGGDGPTLEAMISFIQKSEPVLLPCYAEKALYSGRNVIIIGLCGPQRGGKSNMLTRTEFWALNPDKFVSNPDLSLEWWGQSLENNQK